MPDLGRLTRRYRLLQLAAISLILGALYDWGFGIAMLLAPKPVAALLGIPLPIPIFYLHLIAIFAFMLGALYLAAAREIRRYSVIVVVAIVGRLAGAALFAWTALCEPSLGGLWWLAAADLAFGVAHAAFWLPVRVS